MVDEGVVSELVGVLAAAWGDGFGGPCEHYHTGVWNKDDCRRARLARRLAEWMAERGVPSAGSPGPGSVGATPGEYLAGSAGGGVAWARAGSGGAGGRGAAGSVRSGGGGGGGAGGSYGSVVRGQRDRLQAALARLVPAVGWLAEEWVDSDDVKRADLTAGEVEAFDAYMEAAHVLAAVEEQHRAVVGQREAVDPKTGSRSLIYERGEWRQVATRPAAGSEQPAARREHPGAGLAWVDTTAETLANLLHMPSGTRIVGAEYRIEGGRRVVRLLCEHPDLPTHDKIPVANPTVYHHPETHEWVWGLPDA